MMQHPLLALLVMPSMEGFGPHRPSMPGWACPQRAKAPLYRSGQLSNRHRRTERAVSNARVEGNAIDEVAYGNAVLL
jgi:hypothetical protein